jgi:hypothetical protein
MLHAVNAQHHTPPTSPDGRDADPETPALPLRVSREADEAPSESGQANPETGASPREELDADHIATIRERYASGAYDSVHILTEVARRLLAEGDV